MAAPASLTDRQRQVKDLLDKGMGAREIAATLDPPTTRNAVYQQIRALRNKGALPEGYTPSGEVRTPAPRAHEMVGRITAPPTDGEAQSPADIIASLLQDVARSARELRLIEDRLSRYVQHPPGDNEG